MAWRTLSYEDLATRISQEEIDAYSANFQLGDPVGELLTQTADEVRGYVSANRAAVLSNVDHSIPAMLVGPALDMAVFTLLKRVDLPINEARTEAKKSAEELLAKIAEGKITPEPGETAPGTTPSVAAPSISVKPPIL